MRKASLIYISVTLVLIFIGYYYFRLDDAYIFYKYAKNIAEGNGYVFNIGEKVNATTSPLYTLVLASLYWIVKPFFQNSFIVLSNLISICSIVLIFFSMKKIFNDAERFYWFALFVLAMPLLKFGFGMETYLNLAMIVFSIFLYTKEKYLLSSFFIGLAVLARLDSILFAGIIFLHYIFKNRRFPPVLSILIFLLVIVPWFIFSKIYFDSFLPTTLGAKLSQNELGLFGPGFIFLTGSVRVIPGSYLTVISVLAILLFSMFYLFKKKINVFNNEGLLILAIWGFSLFFSYAFIINAPPYQWYYTPFAIPISAIFAVVLSSLIRKAKFQKIAVTLLFVSACVLPIKNLIEGYNPKYLNYTNVATWLNKNAPEGSLLGVDEIGILGYYYEKGKLVDVLGLINPEVSKHLAQKDFNWFLNNYQPNFIANEYPNIQTYLRGDEKTFRKNYEAIKVFESRGQRIAIYKKGRTKSAFQ